jgi:hypothetical protein
MHDLTSIPPSQARFQSALDTVFEIRPLAGDSTPIAARLAEVRVMRAPEGCEQFSALFVGPAAASHRQQGMYRFVHAALGQMDLFMVPIGPGRTGMQYEVCITREPSDPRPAR